MTHITMTPNENQFFHNLNQIQGCHGTGKIGNLDVHFSRWEKTGNKPKTIKNIFSPTLTLTYQKERFLQKVKTLKGFEKKC